ncbi:MAG TPA: phosphoribosyltransferase family protein [Candidatus Paceibacterota bacterium]|nr:phosphoribosyltransferase family protein [Candidatus Paceibacterota bacterium]
MSNLKNQLQALQIIKKQRVKLTSGLIADFYVDMKAAYASAKMLKLLASKIARRIKNNATCIAGTGYGGLPLASAIALEKNLKLVLIREKARKHGRNTLIDGYVPIKNDNVILVDDVFTTGSSLKRMAKTLKKTKAKILSAHVVVDRSNRSNKLRLSFPISALIRVEELL